MCHTRRRYKRIARGETRCAGSLCRDRRRRKPLGGWLDGGWRGWCQRRHWYDDLWFRRQNGQRDIARGQLYGVACKHVRVRWRGSGCIHRSHLGPHVNKLTETHGHMCQSPTLQRSMYVSCGCNIHAASCMALTSKQLAHTTNKKNPTCSSRAMIHKNRQVYTA